MTVHDDTPTAYPAPVLRSSGSASSSETMGTAEPIVEGEPPSGRLMVVRRWRLRRPGRPGRPGRPSRWTVLWSIVALLLAATAGFVAWLGIGLLGASRDIKTSADAAGEQLDQFKNFATAGQRAEAESYLAAADANLAQARKRAREPQVRAAAHLPVLSTPVKDLNHLLSAATTIAAAGRQGLDLYGQLAGGGTSSVFANGKFDIPVLRSLKTSAEAIDAQMGRAEGELVQVDGTGFKEEGVLVARDKALTQVRSLRKQMTDALPVLSVLPDAVGASGPRTYLVAIMNPTELRASGGAPLSVSEISFDNGVMTQNQARTGTTSEITASPDGKVNTPIAWEPVANDKFYIHSKDMPGKAPFVNAGYNPDFRVAGANMARAWQAQFGGKLDGVIAMDTTAIAQVLAASGPIVPPGYGEVNAANLQQKVLEDAYSPEIAGARHSLNFELMGHFVARLQQGGSIVANARGLAAAVPGRHLQLWFTDGRLKDLITAKRYDGSIATPQTGDHVAVYTQNGNGSKTDVFQARTVSDSIVLAPDGSATVTRTVTIKNTVVVRNPVQLEVKRDFLTGWMRPGVITLLPKGAVITKKPVTTVAGSSSDVDQAGRPFYRSNMEVPPGGTGSWIIEFTVPTMATVSGTSMTATVVAEPQSMSPEQRVHVDLTAPKGWTLTSARGKGASVAGHKAVWDTVLDRARSATVVLTRSGS